MNEELRKDKTVVRNYLRPRSDSELCRLLDRARGGTLIYDSVCRCLVGEIFGAREAIRAVNSGSWLTEVDFAYLRFGCEAGNPSGEGPLAESLRQSRLIPMLLAEFKRRRLPVPEPREVREAVHA